MKNPERVIDWLKRAKSNIARARIGAVSDEILYEDLCFDAQQAGTMGVNPPRSTKNSKIHYTILFRAFRLFHSKKE